MTTVQNWKPTLAKSRAVLLSAGGRGGFGAVGSADVRDCRRTRHLPVTSRPVSAPRTRPRSFAAVRPIRPAARGQAR
jgi:hypothetical protein